MFSPVVITNGTESNVPLEDVWIDSPRLYDTDKKDIGTTGTWINDRVMNAAQHILKQSHPGAVGLHDTVTIGYGVTKVDAQSGVVQCVHDSVSAHWQSVHYDVRVTSSTSTAVYRRYQVTNVCRPSFRTANFLHVR